MAAYHRHDLYGPSLDGHHMQYIHHYLPQPLSRHDGDDDHDDHDNNSNNNNSINDFLFTSQHRCGGHQYDRHGQGINRCDDYQDSHQWRTTLPASYVALSDEDEDFSSYAATPTTINDHRQDSHNSTSDIDEHSLSTIRRPAVPIATNRYDAKREASSHAMIWPSSTAVHGPSRRRHSSDSDDSAVRPHCPHPACLGATGQPTRFFSRRADVARHRRSIHERCFIDCPKRRCPRKGEHGFTRNDHLKEHLVKTHQVDLPRRKARQ